MQKFIALDIAKKMKKVGGDLCHEHRQLISGLNGGYLYDLADYMKEDFNDLACMVRLSLIDLSYLFTFFSFQKVSSYYF